jgi:CRP/FNR family transcriptional regulator, cyclic AMP receptor protein
VAADRFESGTFLALLSDDDREVLLGLGGPRAFATGERLIHEGDPGDHVLVLLAGHVKAGTVDSRGREIVLSFRGPGDVLGELTFTRGDPRSSNVTAIEAVQARAITASDFRRFLEQRSSAALVLIDVISRRFRDANVARFQFGDLDTVGRVAARLVELCERYGETTSAGIEIKLPITQEDLGSWTASSRAGVADALKTLRGMGWIQTERRRITILDLDALTKQTG